MMTERLSLPPTNIVVKDKQRPRLRPSYGVTGTKYSAPSVTSFASSITLSDIDSESGFEDPFFQGSFAELNDQQPGKPQRRRSDVLVMNEKNIRAVSKAAAAESGDVAPSRPSRLRSLASEGGMDHTESEESTSTTEPMPECLQPAITEDYESNLKALRDKAEVFKRIVDIRDRKYNLRSYRNCFVGSEAVDRMIEAGLANSREEAVELGRNWMRYLGLFRHVCDGHDFKDRYLFFEFNQTKTSKSKLEKKWKSAPPRTNGPWYSSLRGGDVTIVEDQPMSQKDLMNASGHQY